MNRLFAIYMLLSLSFCIEAQEQKGFTTLPTSETIVYDICFSSHGIVLGVADGNTVRFFSTETRELLGEYKNGHSDQIMAMDISEDSTFMVSGGRDSSLVIWDVMDRKIISQLRYHSGQITSLKISDNNQFLVSGGTDHTVFVYDRMKQELAHTLTDHTDMITSVDISPDGKLLATAGADKTVRLYDLAEGTLLATFTDHKSWVREVIFNQDGTRLLSCGDRSMIVSRNISNPSEPGISIQKKAGRSWLLGLDQHRYNDAVVTSDFNGRVMIHANLAEFSINAGCPVHRVKFQPIDLIYMKLALATRGKGVLLIESSSMKFHQ